MSYATTCTPEHARRFAEWIATRGGVAVWESVNLSNPGASWSSPARTPEGTPTRKPTWEAANEPARVVTSLDEVGVVTYREVKRLHVAIRRGAQGFTLKLTDASTRRLRAALAKAGDDAVYRFDYERQDAIILVPSDAVALRLWLLQNPAVDEVDTKVDSD